MDENTGQPVAEEQEVAEETTTEETVSEEVEDDELVKAREIAENQKKRAEKAEAELKKLKTQPPAQAPSQNQLSTADTLALVQAQVSPEDVSEVIEYAQYKKISVLEALKSNVVKTMLNDRAEERKTAAATHTGTTRRAPQRVQESTLVANAEKGELPDSDDDMERLWKARKNLK